MSEEAYCEDGGEAEDFAEEQVQAEYDNESSEYIEGSEEYIEETSQERAPEDLKAQSKLEKKLSKLKGKRGPDKEHYAKESYDGEIEELLQDRELTPEKAEFLKEEAKSEYFKTRLVSIDEYIGSWKSQDKANFSDFLKGCWYLFKGFGDFDAEGDRDAYDKIAGMENVPIIYISGAYEYPMSIKDIEEVSGYDIAHFKDRKNPYELQKLIEHTISETGLKPVVIGFSDGVKSIREYIDEFGMNDVSMFYGLAGSMFDAPDPNKMIFVNGSKDRLQILEKDAFKKTSSEVFKVDGGHTWMCYDPVTIQQIFDIIEGTARVERSNFKSFESRKDLLN